MRSQRRCLRVTGCAWIGGLGGDTQCTERSARSRVHGSDRRRLRVRRWLAQSPSTYVHEIREGHGDDALGHRAVCVRLTAGHSKLRRKRRGDTQIASVRSSSGGTAHETPPWILAGWLTRGSPKNKFPLSASKCSDVTSASSWRRRKEQQQYIVEGFRLQGDRLLVGRIILVSGEIFFIFMIMNKKKTANIARISRKSEICALFAFF